MENSNNFRTKQSQKGEGGDGKRAKNNMVIEIEILSRLLVV